MNDPIQIIYEYLSESGTALATLLGGRIWSPVVAAGFKNEEPAIVFHPSGESPEAPANVIANTIVFKCYGGDATFQSARDVAKALYDRLHRARAQTTTGEIMLSRCTNMYQGGEDQDTGWPFQVAIFDITTQ